MVSKFGRGKGGGGAWGGSLVLGPGFGVGVILGESLFGWDWGEFMGPLLGEDSGVPDLGYLMSPLFSGCPGRVPLGGFSKQKGFGHP